MLKKSHMWQAWSRASSLRAGAWRASLVLVGWGALSAGGASAAASPADSGLPGFGYELVSPSSTAGQEPFAAAVGPNGNDVMFGSGGGFADVDNLVSFGTMYRARRTEGEWVTAVLGAPPASEYPFFSGVDADWQEDWWRHERPFSLWSVVPKSAAGDQRTMAAGYKHGPWQEVTPLLGLNVTVAATAADFSGVLVSALPDAKPALTDGTIDGRTSGATFAVIKRKPDGSFDVRQVARQSGGATLHPTCGLNLGGGSGSVLRGAVDRDGLSRVVFTTGGSGACNNATRRRVYVAEPFSSNPDVVEVSASRCTLGAPACGSAATVQFVGGAKDASRLFMMTNQRLLDADVHAGADLYEYDFRREPADRLQLVSSNSTPAQVQGVVAVSDDGSHVYFVANGALDHDPADNDEPQAGVPNLYVRIQGAADEPARTRFVGTLDTGDSTLWAFPNFAQSALTPDGRFLAFTSVARLSAADQDAMRDVYRYDAEAGSVRRAWPEDPSVNGLNRTAESEMETPKTVGAEANFGRNASTALPQIADDGSAIGFTTAEAMAPGDINGTYDAFVWTAETDRVAMISDGKDARGVRHGGMAANGETHLFTTASRITDQHVASSVGLYAYRRGGGFPSPPAPPVPCDAEQCQGPLPPPGSLGGDVGSGLDLGPGNVEPDQPQKVTIAGRRVATGSTLRLAVRVAAPGRIRVSGAGLRTVTKQAGRAGTHRVTVRLTANARRTLQRRGRVTVRARVGVSAAGKRIAAQRTKLTFKSKARGRSSAASNRAKGGR